MEIKWRPTEIQVKLNASKCFQNASKQQEIIAIVKHVLHLLMNILYNVFSFHFIQIFHYFLSRSPLHSRLMHNAPNSLFTEAHAENRTIQSARCQLHTAVCTLCITQRTAWGESALSHCD